MDASIVSPSPESPESLPARLTPMMAQYFEIKAANPDCLLFYRMGDFYELFFDDAEVASRALGIVLTKRGKHDGEDIRMCGVPIERADDYLNRLIALGHRVAVCEQLEDPAEAKKRGGKSVVKRDVVRLVTPGTITEERLLEPGRARLLVAVQRTRGADARWTYGFAALDLSTGAFCLSETDEAGLPAEFARLEPSEIVAAQAVSAKPAFARLIAELRVALTPLRARRATERGRAPGVRVLRRRDARRLRRLYARRDRRGRAGAGLCQADANRGAAGLVAADPPGARREPRDRPGHPRQPRADPDAFGRARRLAARNHRPHRYARRRAAPRRAAREPADRPRARSTSGSIRVGFLIEAAPMRDALRRELAGAPDFLRSLSRLSLDRAGPRDLAARSRRARRGRGAGAAFSRRPRRFRAELLGAHARARRRSRRAGGRTRGDARRRPAARQTRRRLRPRRTLAAARRGARLARREPPGDRRDAGGYADETGVRQLKIRHNNFLGYYIETPQAQGEALLKAPLNATFIHRQTMAGALRFTTNALVELEAKIASAADRALTLELEAFERLRQACLAEGERLRAFGAALAEVDVAAALAELAVKRDWTRPLVDSSLAFRIEGGRHPVVEAALKSAGEPFVANDCDLSGEIGRRRPDRRRHRPQHGGQVDLSAPERADRAARPDGRLRPGAPRACRRGRPAVLPGRRGRRSRPRPLDLHGRNGRDGRDPQPGDTVRW